MPQNIVLFFTDQQRFDTVNENVTPNLAAYRGEAADYVNAYTCQPVCGPARAALQTGEYPVRLGCYKNGIALPSDKKSIAHYLTEAGYDTAYIGKWHLASTGRIQDYQRTAIPKEFRGGYRYWRASDVLEFTSNGSGGYVFDENGKKLKFLGVRADKITDYALEYLDCADKQKPFFLMVSHIEPHHQNSSGKFECPEGAEKEFKDYTLPGDLNALQGNAAVNYPAYLACCKRLDYNFKRIIDKLKELNIYDNTAIIYTSDHGCHFNTRCIEYKRSCHDSSLHIPLLIKGKGYPSEKNEGMVSLIDLPSTILAMAGAALQESFMGRDIGKETGGHVFYEISESQCGRGIRTPEYKYAVRAGMSRFLAPSAPVYYENELYDLNKDPHELHNVMNDPAYTNIKSKLREILLEDIKRYENSEPEIRPKRLIKKFRIRKL